MPAIRIEAPAGPVVSVAELREHLRYEPGDNDATLAALEASVVSELEGPGGALGRVILPQRWREQFAEAGLQRLALPDVTEVSLHVIEGATATLVAGPAWGRDARGAWVDLPSLAAYQPGARWRVDYLCALPEERLPAARLLVKLRVGALDMLREGVVVGTLPPGEMPGGASALIRQLRWRSL